VWYLQSTAAWEGGTTEKESISMFIAVRRPQRLLLPLLLLLLASCARVARADWSYDDLTLDAPLATQDTDGSGTRAQWSEMWSDYSVEVSASASSMPGNDPRSVNATRSIDVKRTYFYSGVGAGLTVTIAQNCTAATNAAAASVSDKARAAAQAEAGNKHTDYLDTGLVAGPFASGGGNSSATGDQLRQLTATTTVKVNVAADALANGEVGGTASASATASVSYSNNVQ
jgi:hypothetical protein